MITAICNIFINSEIKLNLFKETFPLVYPVSDNWLINIRGKFKNEIINFIKNQKKSKENCIFFENLYDNNWAKSTKEMLKQSKYKYVYIFLEDHFLLKKIHHFKNVIRDMINSKIEYFSYSFFNIGLSVKSADGLAPDYSKYFYSFLLDQKKIKFLKKNNKHFYPYALTSICTKKYFNKLLEIENKILIKVPFLLQVIMENIFFFYPKNRIFWFNINKFVSNFGIRFIIYSASTPFNLEKSIFDCNLQLLPLKTGGLKEELFANWDDDNELTNSSLVKRGLYPSTLKTTKKKYELIIEKEYSISKGTIDIKQFYPEINRISHIPIKQLFIKSGSIKIYSDKESYILQKGENIYIYANIPHKIEALENSVYFSKIYLK